MQPCSLTLAGDGRSAAQSSSRPRPRPRLAARSAAGKRCSTGWRACSTMPASPSATSSLRPTGMKATTAGTTATRVYLRSCDAPVRRSGVARRSSKAGLTPDEIDGVVTVSTTGIATPSLEARVGPRLGLRGDVRRVPIFGLGCAGGVNGLATAARLAAAEPGSRWLFVTSRPARSRSASTATIRRRSSPPPCSATAPRPRSSQAASEGIATIAGAAREAVARHAADHGLGRRGSRASRWSSTAPSRRSSRPSWPAPSTTCCAQIGQSAAPTSTASAATPAGSR